MPSVRTSGGATPRRKKSEKPLDLVDPDREEWETGDCVLRIDLLDAPKHEAVPRGPLAPALELYRLSRDRRPEPADARLLLDIGQPVDAYVTRLFEAGVLCAFTEQPKNEAPERAP